MIKTEEVQEQFPKSYEMLKTWVNQQSTIGSKIKEMSKDFNVVPLIKMMLSSSVTVRVLYSFFDESRLEISMIKSEEGFSFEIKGIKKSGKSRIECEENAFIECFRLLESSL